MGKSIDRRTFVGAMGALGALSVAGAALGGQPTAAVAAESAFPAPGKGKPVEASVDPKTGDVTVNGEAETRRGHHLSAVDLDEVDAPWGKAAAIVGSAS